MNYCSKLINNTFTRTYNLKREASYSNMNYILSPPHSNILCSSAPFFYQVDRQVCNGNRTLAEIWALPSELDKCDQFIPSLHQFVCWQITKQFPAKKMSQ